MEPEDRLALDLARARHAQGLLDDALLAEAFTELEAAYMRAWRATSAADTSAREKIFLAVNVVGKVREHLARTVSNGAIAQRELQDLVDAEERDKKAGRHGKRRR